MAMTMQSTTASTSGLGATNHPATTTSANEEDRPEVILSLVWSSGHFGAAYYDSSTLKMHLIADQLDTAPRHSLVFLVLQEVKPTRLLLSARCDDKLVRAIVEFLSPPDDPSSEASTLDKDVVRVLPYKDFAYESSRHRLIHLPLPNVPEGLPDENRFVYMSSLVDFTAVLMVRAAGGLLNFLDQNKRNCLDGSQDCHVIRGLVSSDLKDCVRMPQTAFGCLHIFKEEWHPSVFKCGISKKEGLSLFGLFNQCKSKVGEKELRKLLCRPTKDVDKLCSRQDSIAYFLTPHNQVVIGSLRQCLSHVWDLTNILMRMHVAAITVTQWKTFYKTCESMIAIRGICQSSLTPSDGIDVLNKMASLCVVDLLRVASLVEKIHDFEGSQTAGRFVVNRGIDSVLDERKRIYNGLPDLLTRVAHQELDRLDERIPECQVVYLPQIGYLLTLSQQDVVGVDLPALQFLFACDDKNYYKSGTVKTLDGILGDTMYEIIDRETEIMHKVQNIILEVADTLIDSVAVCGELDALLSLALVAHEHGYVRPSLSADPIIQINGGRHPLVEATASSCVPNSYSSGGPHTKVKVLTGPNNGGKSVYMKTVALIVYMAHIGSYVPAETALIGLVDSIRTCMSVDESVLHGLSSFALELQQMSQIYQGHGERSLVILDEFGKGTRTTNGIGLLVSTIESFLQDSDQCPHVILATHFHMLHDILPSSPLLSHQTFASLHHQGEMVYLYQLIEGHARGSYAGLVGLSAGVARDVIQRQQQILKSRSANSNIGVRRLERKQQDWTEHLQGLKRTHPEDAARFQTTSTHPGLFDETMKHLQGQDQGQHRSP